MAIIPSIPQEIIDEILSHIDADSEPWSLRSCALVSKSWLPSCRRHLFYTIYFAWVDVGRWLETFPVPEESPAHHVKDLCLSVKPYDAPRLDAFSKHILWFTNVESLTLIGRWGLPPSPSRLPPSATSLTLNPGSVTLVRVRDALAQLPNLDSLSLSGSLNPMGKRALLGIGVPLKGRFGGRLQLLEGFAPSHEDVVNMLLEIPTGLRFTEIRIRGACECPLPIVRLVEACGTTLVKLSYTASSRCESRLSSWSE